MSQFSFYRGGIKVIKPARTMSIEEAAAMIRGNEYKDTVEKIRIATDKSVKNVLKSYLDFFTFSGTFSPTRKIENLKKHSGLLTIDFDGIDDIESATLKLYADAYTHLGFISPSGNGIKLVVKIQPKKHLECFQAIESYYKAKYGLTIDPSGKDVCRVCFASHDPKAYFKADSLLFSPEIVFEAAAPVQEQEGAKEVQPEVVVNKVPSVSQKELDTAESRVAMVVQRVVDAQIDITGNYSEEWLLIGLSFASLGENGRQYFHAISRFNSAYDEKATDEKFDHLLKTGRFQNAAKFFSICKDYGVDVRKNSTTQKTEAKKKEEKATEKETKVEYQPVRYHPNYKISVATGRSIVQVADNFWLYIKYMTKDEGDNITWVLEIQMHEKAPIYIELSHEDFCSASKLKKALAAESLSLKITDTQLGELHGYLFGKTHYNKALKVVRYGFHAESTGYFFSNVVLFEDKKLVPDNFGIVQVGKNYLSMPNSKSSKQTRYELTANTITFNDFWLQYGTAHGYENAFVPICFYVFSLFRDVALKEKNFSPILYLKGGAGTGKSSMARILTAAFGRKQQGVNLKSKNTESALVKIMSQASNQICWFDEFHNDFPHEGLLQAAYDNDGYHRSSDTSSIETNAIEIFSALALTSNYLPDNPIFFSRCLFVPITNQAKSDYQRKAFYELEAIQEIGLGCITAELLPHRKNIVQNDTYGMAYRQLYADFRVLFGNENIPERLFANMSQVMAAAYILQAIGVIQLTDIVTDNVDAIRAEFIRIGELCIRRQHRIMSESKAVAEFFEIIQTLYEGYVVHPEVHFRIKGDEILLNFPKLYNLFAPKYRQVFMKTPPDRDTIQSEIAHLAGETDWESLTKAIRFMNDFEGNSNSGTIPIKGSCAMSYEILKRSFGINLETRMSNRD